MISSPKNFIWLCPVLKNDREKMSQLKKHPISINPCVLQGPVTWTKFLSKKNHHLIGRHSNGSLRFPLSGVIHTFVFFFLFHAKAKKKLYQRKVQNQLSYMALIFCLILHKGNQKHGTRINILRKLHKLS